MAVLHTLLFIIFIISAILLTLLVLFRPSEGGGGLGGVFGGGVTDMAFGVKTAKIIDKIILILAIIFIATAIFVTLTSETHIAKQADNTEETRS